MSEQLDKLFAYVWAIVEAKTLREQGRVGWCPDLWTTKYIRQAARRSGDA